MFCGTATSTVTRRSPFLPSLPRMPLPRTRKVRPLEVPAGIFTVTEPPRGVGTATCAPRAASENVTGTVTVTLLFLRPKTGWSLTCTVTNRSPAGPPRSPGPPLPLSRIFDPSFTPAGMRACTVRELVPRPEPWHDGHGSSTNNPRPRHDGQGSAKAKPPAFREVCPVPSHVGHTRGTVPVFAPVPLQTEHGASLLKRSGTVTPSRESSKDSVNSLSRSCPRRGWRLRPPPPPRLNNPPRKSPKPPLLSPNRSSTLTLY